MRQPNRFMPIRGNQSGQRQRPRSTYEGLTEAEKDIYHANGRLIAEAYRRGGEAELERVLRLILPDDPEEK